VSAACPITGRDVCCPVSGRTAAFLPRNGFALLVVFVVSIAHETGMSFCRSLWTSPYAFHIPRFWLKAPWFPVVSVPIGTIRDAAAKVVGGSAELRGAWPPRATRTTASDRRAGDEEPAAAVGTRVWEAKWAHERKASLESGRPTLLSGVLTPHMSHPEGDRRQGSTGGSTRATR